MPVSYLKFETKYENMMLRKKACTFFLTKFSRSENIDFERSHENHKGNYSPFQKQKQKLYLKKSFLTHNFLS